MTLPRLLGWALMVACAPVRGASGQPPMSFSHTISLEPTVLPFTPMELAPRSGPAQAVQMGGERRAQPFSEAYWQTASMIFATDFRSSSQWAIPERRKEVHDAVYLATTAALFELGSALTIIEMEGGDRKRILVPVTGVTRKTLAEVMPKQATKAAIKGIARMVGKLGSVLVDVFWGHDLGDSELFLSDDLTEHQAVALELTHRLVWYLDRYHGEFPDVDNQIYMNLDLYRSQIGPLISFVRTVRPLRSAVPNNANGASVTPAAAATSATRYDITLPDSGQAPHYWIVILARPAGTEPRTPGHAFVEFGYENAKTHATEHEAWGFYPENGEKGFTKVPGSISDDLKSGALAKQTVLVSVAVPKAAYDAALRVKADWSAKPPEYHLFTAKNCIDFADAMAKVLGLQTPDRSKMQWPVDYVDGLGRTNQPPQSNKGH